jgi:hypothetical protein
VILDDSQADANGMYFLTHLIDSVTCPQP